MPAKVTPAQAIQLAPQTTSLTSPGDRYLSIVFKNGVSTGDHNTTSTKVPNDKKTATRQQLDLEEGFCAICHLPIDARGGAASTAFSRHESTISHMVCLTHSYPPSHLDRSRQGFKYLSSYGWDPDSRQGLGATGEGIRAPIKAKLKNDTVGLGVKTKGNKKAEDPRVEKLNAKQVRRKGAEDSKRRERLQEMFYMNGDVQQYLGRG